MEKIITNLDQLVVGEIYQINQFIRGYDNIIIAKYLGMIEYPFMWDTIILGYNTKRMFTILMINDPDRITTEYQLHNNALTYLKIKQI